MHAPLIPATLAAFIPASTMLLALLVIGVLVSIVLAVFPAIRRANALWAPVLVFLTLAGTIAALGGTLWFLHTRTGFVGL